MKKYLSKLFSFWIVGSIGFVIIGIYLFLRIYNLNSLPIFADEAIYIRWAQVMRAESTLRFLPLSDGKQPLLMWSIIPLLKVFSNPLTAGRMLSVITGLATLTGVFVLSKLLFKSNLVSLSASLFYVLSPFTLFFDRMALTDSMLSMFGIWVLIFGIVTVKSKRLDYAMLIGFCLGGALLTKSTALFFSILLPTTILFMDWRKGNKDRIKTVLNLSFLFLVAYLIAYALFNILRLGPNFHLLGMRNLDYVWPYSHVLSSPMDPLIPHLKSYLDWTIKMGPGIIWLFAAGGLLTAIKKHQKEVILLSIWAFLPLIVQAEYAKVFTARYILFTLPYLFIIAALGFMSVSKKIKLSLFGLTFVFLVLSLTQSYYLLTNPIKMNLPRSERSGYLEEWTAGYGIKEVADFILEIYKNNPGEMLVGTEGYFGTLPDGLQIYLNNYPQIKVLGVGVNLTEVPQSLRDSINAQVPTYLVINNSRLRIANPALEGLELIDSYQKAQKPQGLTEELYFFKVDTK